MSNVPWWLTHSLASRTVIVSNVPWRLTHSLAYLLKLKLPDSCCCSVHCSTGPQQNVDDDYCACRVKAVGERGGFWTGAPLGVNPALTIYSYCPGPINPFNPNIQVKLQPQWKHYRIGTLRYNSGPCLRMRHRPSARRLYRFVRFTIRRPVSAAAPTPVMSLKRNLSLRRCLCIGPQRPWTAYSYRS